MAKFLTQEWWDEIVPVAKDKFSAGKTPTKLSMTLVEVYEECDDDAIGEYIWSKYVLDNGVLVSAEYGTDEDDTPEGDYVIYGTAESYAKVLRGDVPLPKAAVSGMFQIEGNMLKAMKMLGTYMEVINVKKNDGKTTF